MFHDADPTELQQILAGNAAKLYDFDLDALAPLADAVRPDRRRDRASRSPSCPENPNKALIRGAAGTKLIAERQAAAASTRP